MTHIIILAIIQGITEFLPISSSAHLFLIPHIFGWPESSLSFDVALHAGTLAATLIYFWRVWWNLLVKGLIQRQKRELNLIGLLLVATIPAALIGFFAGDMIESTFRIPVLAAVMLIIFGIILWLAEKYWAGQKTIAAITWQDSLFIGVAQALALIPGVSRSGITMTSGLVRGMKQEEAAQFSFLLLAPITFGAIVTQLGAIADAPNTKEIAIGVVVSFIVGLASIHFLLKFVKKYGFAPYVWYRVIAGLVFLCLLVKS